MRLRLDIHLDYKSLVYPPSFHATVSPDAVRRHILAWGVSRTVKASFGKCTRTSTVAGGSRVLGLMTTSSGDIATSVPIVGLQRTIS